METGNKVCRSNNTLKTTVYIKSVHCTSCTLGSNNVITYTQNRCTLQFKEISTHLRTYTISINELLYIEMTYTTGYSRNSGKPKGLYLLGFEGSLIFIYNERAVHLGQTT